MFYSEGKGWLEILSPPNLGPGEVVQQGRSQGVPVSRPSWLIHTICWSRSLSIPGIRMRVCLDMDSLERFLEKEHIS